MPAFSPRRDHSQPRQGDLQTEADDRPRAQHQDGCPPARKETLVRGPGAGSDALTRKADSVDSRRSWYGLAAAEPTKRQARDGTRGAADLFRGRGACGLRTRRCGWSNRGLGSAPRQPTWCRTLQHVEQVPGTPVLLRRAKDEESSLVQRPPRSAAYRCLPSVAGTPGHRPRRGGRASFHPQRALHVHTSPRSVRCPSHRSGSRLSDSCGSASQTRRDGCWRPGRKRCNFACRGGQRIGQITERLRARDFNA